jgi:putative transposase
MQRLYGRKIGDLGFSDFVRILRYEASKFGTMIVEVGRFFASSQLCSECGYQNSQVKDLSVRQWICPKCGAHHDRDRNAALNIFQKGLGQRPLQEIL